MNLSHYGITIHAAVDVARNNQRGVKFYRERLAPREDGEDSYFCMNHFRAVRLLFFRLCVFRPRIDDEHPRARPAPAFLPSPMWV
jgi:hypothetical protein